LVTAKWTELVAPMIMFEYVARHALQLFSGSRDLLHRWRLPRDGWESAANDDMAVSGSYNNQLGK
jgi:hypothetical protein